MEKLLSLSEVYPHSSAFSSKYFFSRDVDIKVASTHEMSKSALVSAKPEGDQLVDVRKRKNLQSDNRRLEQYHPKDIQPVGSVLPSIKSNKELLSLNSNGISTYLHKKLPIKALAIQKTVARLETLGLEVSKSKPIPPSLNSSRREKSRDAEDNINTALASRRSSRNTYEPPLKMFAVEQKKPLESFKILRPVKKDSDLAVQHAAPALRNSSITSEVIKTLKSNKSNSSLRITKRTQINIGSCSRAGRFKDAFKKNQDAFVKEFSLLGNPNFSFFAVFDGHGKEGGAVSAFLTKVVVSSLC